LYLYYYYHHIIEGNLLLKLRKITPS